MYIFPFSWCIHLVHIQQKRGFCVDSLVGSWKQQFASQWPCKKVWVQKNRTTKPQSKITHFRRCTLFIRIPKCRCAAKTNWTVVLCVSLNKDLSKIILWNLRNCILQLAPQEESKWSYTLWRTWIFIFCAHVILDWKMFFVFQCVPKFCKPCRGETSFFFLPNTCVLWTCHHCIGVAIDGQAGCNLPADAKSVSIFFKQGINTTLEMRKCLRFLWPKPWLRRLTGFRWALESCWATTFCRGAGSYWVKVVLITEVRG